MPIFEFEGSVAVTGPALLPTLQRLRSRRRPHLVGELLVVLCLLRVYDLVRGRAEVRQDAAVRHGQGILAAERWLHLDPELWANDLATSHRWLELVSVWWYQTAHLTVSLGMLAWCYLARPEVYRWARTSLVAINVLALAVFFALPVAPPRLLPGSGFVDSAVAVGFAPGPVGPVHADQFGAMPSLHLAWAAWVVMVAFAAVRGPRVRRAWSVYPLITTCAVVLTANHYLLDVVAGATLAAVCCLVVAISSHPARAAALSPPPQRPAAIPTFEASLESRQARMFPSKSFPQVSP